MHRAQLWSCALGLALAGCGGPVDGPDSGGIDAGDAGQGTEDARPPDARPPDARPPDAAARCGDGRLDPGEACDGTALGGRDCAGELGAGATGTLECTAECTIDASRCELCGNGTVEGGERCDGTPADTCESLGHDGGTLGCTAACTFDESGCTDCGDGVAEGAEACDGADLGGESCASRGFVTGMLACNAACAFDERGCTDCGNDVRDAPEECDGADLGGESCTSRGFDDGTLGCTASCLFDERGCSTCGDGLASGPEECDGADLGGSTCESRGLGSGTLGCTRSCTFDTGGCFACGDGVVNGAEQCDGTELGGATCVSRGLDGGMLGCTSSCTFDTSGCFDCGDGTINGAEECDGSALGGATCVSRGLDGGVLGCSSTCTFDTSGCFDCGDGTINGAEECDGAALGAATCASRGHTAGTLGCTPSCTFDETACTDCGDGVAEGAEECDGADLRSATCVTRGFASGRLACGSACTYDPSSCSTAPPPMVGQIVISEIMQDPAALPDGDGEWFEVVNVGTGAVNLFGCVVYGPSSVADRFTIDRNLIVAAGAYATFATTGTVSPGFTPDYLWPTGFSLTNGSDAITIECGGTMIDTVAYDNGVTFPDPTGASMTLGAPAPLDATANDVGSNWCVGRNVYSTGDRGTPGAPNDRCRWDVSFCRLQFPLTITGEPGVPTRVFGRVYAAGLTDATGGNDPDPLLVAHVGYGPDGTSPATAPGWVWAPAMPNPGYGPGSPGYEANNDEYEGDLAAATAGTYDFAYRFSGDGGRTWLHCDGGAAGSSDGYAPADAGQMTVAGCQPVINELQVAGATAADEFIEIHNPCASSFDLTGGRLVYRSASGTSDVLLVSFTGSTVLAAGDYRLYATTAYTGGGTVDGTFTTGLAGAAGGLALRAASMAILDSVGYGTATNAFVETAPCTAPPTNQSAARVPNGVDTNDNSADFRSSATRSPRAANP